MRTQPQEVIAKLEADNSRLAKEAILLSAMQEGLDEFFEGVRMCLDKLYTFGVKQVPEKDTVISAQGCEWKIFKKLAEQLHRRELTGHAARDAINLVMGTATAEQWNGFYRRILIKDLRCGVSEKTVNSVATKNKFKQYEVPVFTCQLAHDSANHEKKLVGKKMLEVKLDGVRVITIVYPDGKVDMFSRNGKEFTNFGHISDQISQVVKKSPPPYPVVLDGEVMSENFQDLMKQVHRKESVGALDAVLHLFDFLPLSNFMEGYWDKKQTDRTIMLKAWYDQHKSDLNAVTVLAHEIVDLDTAEGQKTYTEVNKRAVEGGYEGIMIKDLSAGYECKRSHAWLKLKPFIEVSLTIKDVEEGTGKNVGKLGAFIVEGMDDNKLIKSNVGSGLTDEDRETFWKDKDSLIGQVIEVRADAVTQNQDAVDEYSLRFPRFMKFRGFAKGEKL
jgi:DNA ligase-1